MRTGTMGRITSSSATMERFAVVAASQIIGLMAALDDASAAAGPEVLAESCVVAGA